MNLSTTDSPVYRHACMFATNTGMLTEDSIRDGQAKFNDDVKIRRDAVLAACENDPSVKKVCSIVNEARSGIWNTDGSLNIERLRELKVQCITFQGVLIITESIFKNFVNERRASLNHSHLPDILSFGNFTCVKTSDCLPFIQIPIPFTAVTDGSIDALIHHLSDRKYNGEKAVTWEKVSEFYDPDNISKLRDQTFHS